MTLPKKIEFFSKAILLSRFYPYGALVSTALSFWKPYQEIILSLFLIK